MQGYKLQDSYTSCDIKLHMPLMHICMVCTRAFFDRIHWLWQRPTSQYVYPILYKKSSHIPVTADRPEGKQPLPANDKHGCRNPKIQMRMRM